MAQFEARFTIMQAAQKLLARVISAGIVWPLVFAANSAYAVLGQSDRCPSGSYNSFCYQLSLRAQPSADDVNWVNNHPWISILRPDLGVTAGTVAETPNGPFDTGTASIPGYGVPNVCTNVDPISNCSTNWSTAVTWGKALLSIAPQLKSDFDSGDYSAALTLLNAQANVGLAATPALWMLVGAKPLTADQMSMFYTAMFPYWASMVTCPNINTTYTMAQGVGTIFQGQIGNCLRPQDNNFYLDNNTHLAAAAAKNAATAGDNQYPDMPRFMETDVLHESTFEGAVDVALKVGAAVMTGVASAGLASAFVGAMTTTVATTTATGATIATTSVGGVTLSTTTTLASGAISTSTTLAGTAVTAAADGVASGVITTAINGGSLGQNLVSSLEGAAVGTAMAPGTSALSSAMSSAGLNTTASNFVASIATGTASGAILNGGNFNQAFVSAATGAGIGALTNELNSLATNNSPASSQSFDPNSTQSTGNIDSAAAARTAYVNGTSMNGSSVANDFQPANLQPLTIAQLNQSVGAVDLSSVQVPVINVASTGADFSNLNSGFDQAATNLNSSGSVAAAAATYVDVAGAATAGTSATSNALGSTLTDIADPNPIVTAYHGSPVNGLSEIIPGGGNGPMSGTLAKSGYGSASNFLDTTSATMTAEGYSQQQIDEALGSLTDRMTFEAGKIGVFLDPNLASTYAGANGTVYQVQVPTSSLYTAGARPSSSLVEEGGSSASSEYFAAGSYSVTGTAAPYSSVVTSVSTDTSLLGTLSDVAAGAGTFGRAMLLTSGGMAVAETGALATAGTVAGMALGGAGLYGAFGAGYSVGTYTYNNYLQNSSTFTNLEVSTGNFLVGVSNLVTDHGWKPGTVGN